MRLPEGLPPNKGLQYSPPACEVRLSLVRLGKDEVTANEMTVDDLTWY